jgi:hypothetical protein
VSDTAWFVLGGIFAVAAAIFYASREVWIHRRRARRRDARW